METVPVKIDELLLGFEAQNDEHTSWLHRPTGRVLTLETSLLNALDDDENDDDEDEPTAPFTVNSITDEFLDHARAIAAEDDTYLPLPTRYDFHEHAHMMRFAATVADPAAAHQLTHALHGRGAFRYFKDTARRLDLLDAWYAHPEAALRRLILDWAEKHGVPVDETPGPAPAP
jgi:hypothetical protein